MSQTMCYRYHRPVGKLGLDKSIDNIFCVVIQATSMLVTGGVCIPKKEWSLKNLRAVCFIEQQDTAFTKQYSGQTKELSLAIAQPIRVQVNVETSLHLDDLLQADFFQRLLQSRVLVVVCTEGIKILSY